MLAPGDTQAAIAESAGVDQTTAGRWVRGEVSPSAASATLFAKAHGRNPVEAWVAAGLIPESVADLSREERAFLRAVRRRPPTDTQTVRATRKRRHPKG